MISLILSVLLAEQLEVQCKQVNGLLYTGMSVEETSVYIEPNQCQESPLSANNWEMPPWLPYHCRPELLHNHNLGSFPLSKYQ